MYTKGIWTVTKNKFGDILITAYDETPLSLKHSAIGDIPKNNDNAEANANLIVTAVNSCTSVNSDNPQAVAESIKDMYEALKLALDETPHRSLGDDVKLILRRALSKAERRRYEKDI